MKLLTTEQQKSYESAIICYISKERIENKYVKYKQYQKVKDHCHYTGGYRGILQSIYNLKYSIPKKLYNF